jgi:hypothetical protein
VSTEAVTGLDVNRRIALLLVTFPFNRREQPGDSEILSR